MDCLFGMFIFFVVLFFFDAEVAVEMFIALVAAIASLVYSPPRKRH